MLTLWQAIDGVIALAPFEKKKVEAFLNTPLKEGSPESNEFFEFWRGAKIDLKDGISISKIDLRLAKSKNHPGFMVIDLGGACVSIAALRSHYDGLEIVESPRGQSLQESTWHRKSWGWGSVSFGFREANPNCLSQVAFNPTQ